MQYNYALLCSYNILLCTFCSEIVIGLRETVISVNEGEGEVEVCAVVISGELERSVPFSLTSADGTAIGELYIFYYIQ